MKTVGFTITGSRVQNRYKNAVCSTDINLNVEDFPTLSRIVPARNSIYFSKSILKLLVLVPFAQVNSIENLHVPPRKPVSASSARTGKPISNRNVRLSKTVSPTSVS